MFFPPLNMSRQLSIASLVNNLTDTVCTYVTYIEGNDLSSRNSKNFATSVLVSSSWWLELINRDGVNTNSHNRKIKLVLESDFNNCGNYSKKLLYKFLNL